VLLGQEVAERQREHDRRHEQRLDDRQPAAIERSRLERVADQQGDGADQPRPLTGESHERHRLGERHRGEIESTLLL
jgi:hypothetical protein